ncbi:mechanosensitive ion channel family protein [Halorarum halophilum]|uniref:Mechanosensitive ion channel family protein n=1 Tax=Halorarum halophilum TaxID=2743090 RepID=A0A7D5K6C0_9EURY|nr:mechanosensitive ion channel family protein [Halobaculum halophilum]QLG26579.1 mechanosensitive ion channel family protein [Halobaculum halophilum]
MTGAAGAQNGTQTPTAFPTGNETTGSTPLFPPEVTEPLHELFPTVEAQLVGTLMVVVGLLLVGELIRASGDPLKERYNDTLVEAAQAGTMAVLTALVGIFFVVVWRGGAVVLFLIDVLDIEERDIAKLMFTAVILAGAYSLTRVTKRSVKRIGKRRGALSQHQRQIAHHVVQVTIFIVAVLVALSLWKVNIGGLLVGAGFAGIVLGLAARQTLGAVLAGFVVLFSRPFELGDWVRIGEHEGIVTDINIVNTQLRTYNDEFLMVPNDTVTSQEILNRSRKGRLRINVDVGVDYDADLEEAIDIAEGVMADREHVLEKPNPQVVLPEFGDSAVVLRLRFYIDNPSARKMWKARTNVIAALKSAFDDAGVTIPFPQRELSARGGRPAVDVTEAVADNGAPPETESNSARDRGAGTGAGDAE